MTRKLLGCADPPFLPVTAHAERPSSRKPLRQEQLHPNRTVYVDVVGDEDPTAVLMQEQWPRIFPGL